MRHYCCNAKATHLSWRERYSAQKPIPIHDLKDIVNSQLKNEIVKAEEVTIPIDPARSYEFGLIKGNPDGWNYFNNILIYKNVYVNQYTGKVLAVYDKYKNPLFLHGITSFLAVEQ
jgi:hypothetical protein